MDLAIKYKVNTGESGKFNVNLIIAEYWADLRKFGIKIAGKEVAAEFTGPQKNGAMIATFKNNKVIQG